MPTISSFYGIVIRMFVNDHPVRMDHLFPPRATRLVKEWMAMHRTELTAAWRMAEDGFLPGPIEALDADEGD